MIEFIGVGQTGLIRLADDVRLISVTESLQFTMREDGSIFYCPSARKPGQAVVCDIVVAPPWATHNTTWHRVQASMAEVLAKFP